MPGNTRSNTWGSSFSSSNFATQGESSRRQSWVSDQYADYFITWDKLKAWLERRFPNPPEPYPVVGKVERSNYQFKVPHKLTEAERKSIEKEHDRPFGKQSKRAVSPGG